ncbi:MAG: hypothetical protein JJ971_07695 [Balneolaceae bacterium]|nr:hypothetical protein [Balneolaceae bacterium]MBO6546882.1 hypothetical protein [Balneolaceae bacterium]MBO6649242.1 hypothetical protein [Balneolaceae bacterium]
MESRVFEALKFGCRNLFEVWSVRVGAYPEKHDGVVNISSVLWSMGDAFIGDHNQYFSDVPADGGYNHFELRNHKRAYTLPGQFAKGDLNPSMEEVANWIKDDYGNSGN